MLLIVNIATKNHKCSVQLGELSALEKQYKSQGLEVLLFPWYVVHTKLLVQLSC